MPLLACFSGSLQHTVVVFMLIRFTCILMTSCHSYYISEFIGMSFGKKIRMLDVFKKLPSDLTEPTNRGGLVSLLTALAILTFIVVQIYKYLNPDYQSMILPMRRQFRRKMKINVDVHFPRVPCLLMTLEMQDAVFSQNYEISTVQKIPLDRDGKQLRKMRQVSKEEEDQLFFQLNLFQEAKRALASQEGCRMVGSFEANEVPGVFRFAPFANQQLFASLMAQEVIEGLDFSHHIKLLSFGDLTQNKAIVQTHPKALIETLSNSSKSFKKSKSTYYHYHLDIVPTFYRDGQTIQSYQYVYKTNKLQDYAFSVVYFQYQLGGLALEVHRDKEVQAQFIIKLCAVVGGTFTVASFLNNALEWWLDDRRKGYELIK